MHAGVYAHKLTKKRSALHLARQKLDLISGRFDSDWTKQGGGRLPDEEGGCRR